MARKRNKQESKTPRSLPLIRRMLIASLDIAMPKDVPHDYTIHLAGTPHQALRYMNNYSYDVIAITTGAASAEIVDVLVNRYKYDSLICVQEGYTPLATINIIEAAGYKIEKKPPHELFPVEDGELIRRRYDGNKI